MNILDLVDVEATNRAVAEHEAKKVRETLDPHVESAAREAAQRAWHAALGEGKGRDAAMAAAKAAFEARAMEVIASPSREPSATAVLGPTPSLAKVVVRDRAPTEAVAAGAIDHVGAERAKRDMAAAAASGFAVAQPLYDIGSRVNVIGVANARRERASYESKPLIGDAMSALAKEVRDEHRREVLVAASEIGMTERGEIEVRGDALPITRDAFGSLCSRLGFGGGGYLANCSPSLRAHNVNEHRKLTVEADRTMSPIKLRIRDRANGREVFAAVGPSYSAFDVDRVAEAVALASPPEARGAVQYDAATSRTKIDVLFHSDVRPESFVAGEVWKAGIQVRTDDTGGGSLRVDAIVFQNLCLNLIIINRMAQPIARIRHIGSVHELARRFRCALAEAHDKLGAFIRAWGYGSREDVVARIAAVHADVPRQPLDALPGIFNGILETERVKIPGARDRAIAALLAAWEFDQSSARMSADAQRVGGVTRTAIVNAFTRVAHTLPFEDAFIEDEIQRDAAALLWPSRGDAPAALPYEPLDDVLAKRVTVAA